ncbi:hypothetical protein IscW_ISCW000968 [Ixodes scapularis]|uniref:Uncharacterized protein n=1 Tax=Ixodes scapularis TaxID=6945 RepID=B7P633_IXOSC|nr:hypothetical protein IscW_ISCW000968 [Ixodes scapularis]|eukprot:XP_002408341.1 hypothetical protein IscW_ISCW000968 [Ixodes scapularis]
MYDFNKNSLKVLRLQVASPAAGQLTGHNNQHPTSTRRTVPSVDDMSGGIDELAVVERRVEPRFAKTKDGVRIRLD